jgi:hypothetical protein
MHARKAASSHGARQSTPRRRDLPENREDPATAIVVDAKARSARESVMELAAALSRRMTVFAGFTPFQMGHRGSRTATDRNK